MSYSIRSYLKTGLKREGVHTYLNKYLLFQSVLIVIEKAERIQGCVLECNIFCKVKLLRCNWKNNQIIVLSDDQHF